MKGRWRMEKKLPRAAGVCTLVGMHHVVRCATRLVACDCIKSASYSVVGKNFGAL